MKSMPFSAKKKENKTKQTKHFCVLLTYKISSNKKYKTNYDEFITSYTRYHLHSVTQIEKVFNAASHKKVWDHFTKAQRKNIDMWKKQSMVRTFFFFFSFILSFFYFNFFFYINLITVYIIISYTY